MPAWNPLPTLPPRRFPLAHLGATALSLGWSVLYLALGRGPHNDIKTAGPRSAGRLPQAAPVLVQTLARPCFCPDQTPRHVNFRAASLRELSSGTWLATNNSSMAAMSRARLYGDEPVRTQFPKFRVEKAGKAP
jgi:hypothetical protein